MQTINEEHDGYHGAQTSTLVRTILEIRRALLLAVSMLQELMQAGTVMEWMDEVPIPSLERPMVFSGPPNLEISSGSASRAYPKGRSTPRTSLQLVKPFRHGSALVMPDNARDGKADASAREHAHDRRRADAREGKAPDASTTSP